MRYVKVVLPGRRVGDGTSATRTGLASGEPCVADPDGQDQQPEEAAYHELGEARLQSRLESIERGVRERHTLMDRVVLELVEEVRRLRAIVTRMEER